MSQSIAISIIFLFEIQINITAAGPERLCNFQLKFHFHEVMWKSLEYDDQCAGLTTTDWIVCI